MALSFQTYSPSEKFKPYINFYWTIESSEYEAPFQERVYPTGSIELMFHYGDRFKSLNNGNQFQPTISLCGQKSKFDLIETSGYAGAIVCNFKGYGAKQFFNIPMNEISDINLDLYLLCGYNIEYLKEKLFNAKTNIDRIIIIEKYLEKNFLDKEEYHVNQIGKSFDYFNNSFPITIEDLADKTNLSLRQLQRKYLKYVGLSPKQCSRIIRFNKVREIIELRKSSLSESVYSAYYYDQSHMILDFKEFMGLTPSNYLKVLNESVNDFS